MAKSSKATEKQMQENAIDETTMFPETATHEVTKQPTSTVSNGEVIREGEFEQIAFKQVSDMIPFHNFKTDKVLTGIFQGEGKTIGDGDRATRTWLIKKPDGSLVYVPHWAMLNELHQKEANAWYVRITYNGLHTRSDKSSFHMVNLEIAERKMS